MHAPLRSLETLREKFDRERDMYLKRIKDLEERLVEGTSRKDLTTPKFSERPKGDSPGTLGDELVHGVKEKESKESTSVPLAEGGHSEKPVGSGDSASSEISAVVVIGTATAESCGTDLT